MDRLLIANKYDPGLIWAKTQATYSQLGTISGMVAQLMQVGVFYATVVKGWIPLWVYLIVLATGLGLVLLFILKIGISGYYRFFNQQSAVDNINRKVNLIMQRLEIEDDCNKS